MQARGPGGEQDFKAQEAAAPKVSVQPQQPGGCHGRALLHHSCQKQNELFQDPSAPACALLLPTQHFCHPLRGASLLFLVPISISGSADLCISVGSSADARKPLAPSSCWISPETRLFCAAAEGQD